MFLARGLAEGCLLVAVLYYLFSFKGNLLVNVVFGRRRVRRKRLQRRLLPWGQIVNGVRAQIGPTVGFHHCVIDRILRFEMPWRVKVNFVQPQNRIALRLSEAPTSTHSE